jgi:acyl carrier protein
LEQVEAELLKHDNIKEAVVLAGEKEGNAFLCAYVVPRSSETFRAADFRDYLDQRLPYYMVPSYFVPLERIPLTANGKLNRRALPQPESGKTGEEYVAPTNQLEKQLADILKEVLKLDKVGINDNFFDIGGNSLNFVQVNEKLKEVWGKDIAIVVMFQYPTIRSLCGHLNEGKKDEGLSQKENEHEAFKKVGDTMEEAVELFDNL